MDREIRFCSIALPRSRRPGSSTGDLAMVIVSVQLLVSSTSVCLSSTAIEFELAAGKCRPSLVRRVAMMLNQRTAYSDDPG